MNGSPWPPTTSLADRLWETYSLRRSLRVRNRIIEHYLHLPQIHAGIIRDRFPPEVQLDDLIAAGNVGLIWAVEHFEPSRGYKFETFSSRRIRGAMLDALRSFDWVPRLARSRQARYERVLAELQAELDGRRPTDQDLTRRLGVDAAEFERIRRDAGVVTQVSLSSPMRSRAPDGGGASTLGEMLDVPAVSDMGTSDVIDVLLEGLSRQEQLIMRLYACGHTRPEIGKAIGISRSRVNQLFNNIVARLQAKFGHRPDIFLGDAQEN